MANAASMKRAEQATAPKTVPLTESSFAPHSETAVYWLGNAGILINSHGTAIMIDPVLSTLPEDTTRSEMGRLPLLAPPPILAGQVSRLDAVLYTHADEDHLGTLSAPALVRSGAVFHGPPVVAKKLASLGIPANRIIAHPSLDTYTIDSISIQMTLADHAWQAPDPAKYGVPYTREDCCGYRITTSDGVIWDPGDTVLLPEHLRETGIDLLFIDFSEDVYHFGRENAITLANTLSGAALIMFHWGTLFAPGQPCLCADPADVAGRLVRPERLHILGAGEKYVL